MKRALVALASCIALSACSQDSSLTSKKLPQSEGAQSSVYGRNDIKEAFEITHPNPRSLYDSVSAQFPSKFVVAGKDSHQVLWKNYTGLCSDEPLAQQPMDAQCTGFLIAPDLVLTAEHCIKKVPCEDSVFVFGYRYEAKGNLTRTYPNDNVYRCKEVVAREYDRPNFIDYAVARLDRPTKNRKIMELSTDSTFTLNSPIVSFGYHLGTPMKVSSGSILLDEGNRIQSDIDTYSGASGAPIINAKDGKVIGLLIRGPSTTADKYPEFILRPEQKCYTLRKCETVAECGGAITIQKISPILDILKDL